ncbi:MAG: prepilin-type N-terminal cleavage/methylation domain-containing protein, partial [Patescibacteria group bacterium]
MKLPKDLKLINKGFTLIELLVVIGITGILLGLSLFVGNDFYRVYSLTSERDNLISYIRKARSRALSNYNQSAHGFAINGSQYTIFQGSSFTSRSSTWDQTFNQSPGLT